MGSYYFYKFVCRYCSPVILSLFAVALSINMFLQLMAKIFNNKSTVIMTDSDILRSAVPLADYTVCRGCYRKKNLQMT